jgi:hypothetical protein
MATGMGFSGPMPDLFGRGPLGLKTGKTPRKAKDPHPIRRAAQGQRCTLRLPGCNETPVNVFLCHIRRFGWAGMGQKPHDLLGVFGCQHCHDVMDGRILGECSDTDLLRAHGETVMMLLHNGIIEVL